MIEPYHNAPDGSVRTLSRWDSSTIGAADAILCRNTAPLISAAFSLLRNHHPCRVLGRDIGQGLQALVKKMKATNLQDLDLKLDKYAAAKILDLERKGKDSMVASIKDKVECIKLFMENCKSVAETVATIDNLFNDKTNVTTLATIHKAKGLEWQNVYILNSWLMPSKYAIQPWQRQQEVNLIYVAITRSKLNLYYIDLEDFER